MSTIRSRTAASLLAALAIAATSGCAHWRTAPEPEAAVTDLLVANHSRFDVTVYTRGAPYGHALRVGTVAASSSVWFPLHAHDLDATGRLVVRLFTQGPGTTWTSDALPITADIPAILDVNTDMSGDCSGTTLRTTLSSGPKRH